MLKGFRRALSGTPRPGCGGAREAWRPVARGNQLIGRGDLEGARKAFEAAVATDPDYAPAWNNLGVVVDRGGRPLDALPHFNHAIKLSPSFVDAWCNKGVALLHLDRPSRAEECFQAALQVDPGSGVALLNLGVLRARRGDLRGATDAFALGLRGNPHHPAP